jgi:predicted CopG family antitoxin
MSPQISVDDDLYERLESHLEADETVSEFVEELLNIYESDRFIQEGYSE